MVKSEVQYHGRMSRTVWPSCTCPALAFHFLLHPPCCHQTTRGQPAGPRPRTQDDDPGFLGGSGSGNSFIRESLPFIPCQVERLGSLQCLWGKELEDLSLLREISDMGGSAASDASCGQDVASAMADLKSLASKPPPKQTKPSEPSASSRAPQEKGGPAVEGAWLFEEVHEDHEPTFELKEELEAALKTEADYAARENDAADELESGGGVADDADDSDSGPDAPDGLDGRNTAPGSGSAAGGSSSSTGIPPAPTAGAAAAAPSGSGGSGAPGPPATFFAPGSDEHPYSIYDRYMNDSRGLRRICQKLETATAAQGCWLRRLRMSGPKGPPQILQILGPGFSNPIASSHLGRLDTPLLVNCAMWDESRAWVGHWAFKDEGGKTPTFICLVGATEGVSGLA